MNNIIKVLIIAFTIIFSLACGLFLVQYSIPAYFKLFSPFSKTLRNFYISTVFVALILFALDVILFKIRKYNWGIWLLGTAVVVLGFGIPIFMLENNEMIWHEAVFRKTGPAYFIDFSEEVIYALKYIHNLYSLIWERVYFYVYAVIIIYAAAYWYLRRQGWRVRGIRIKF